MYQGVQLKVVPYVPRGTAWGRTTCTKGYSLRSYHMYQGLQLNSCPDSLFGYLLWAKYLCIYRYFTCWHYSANPHWILCLMLHSVSMGGNCFLCRKVRHIQNRETDTKLRCLWWIQMLFVRRLKVFIDKKCRYLCLWELPRCNYMGCPDYW